MFLEIMFINGYYCVTQKSLEYNWRFFHIPDLFEYYTTSNFINILHKKIYIKSNFQYLPQFFQAQKIIIWQTSILIYNNCIRSDTRGGTLSEKFHDHSSNESPRVPARTTFSSRHIGYVSPVGPKIEPFREKGRRLRPRYKLCQ